MDFNTCNKWEETAFKFILPIYSFCYYRGFSKWIRILGLLLQFILFPIWLVSIFIGVSIFIIIMSIDMWDAL